MPEKSHRAVSQIWPYVVAPGCLPDMRRPATSPGLVAITLTGPLVSLGALLPRDER